MAARASQSCTPMPPTRSSPGPAANAPATRSYVRTCWLRRASPTSTSTRTSQGRRHRWTCSSTTSDRAISLSSCGAGDARRRAAAASTRQLWRVSMPADTEPSATEPPAIRSERVAATCLGWIARTVSSASSSRSISTRPGARPRPARPSRAQAPGTSGNSRIRPPPILCERPDPERPVYNAPRDIETGSLLLGGVKTQTRSYRSRCGRAIFRSASSRASTCGSSSRRC